MAKSLLIERTNGEHLIVEDIPDDAKVTFSSVNPASPRGWDGYCVRVYTGKDDQLAVFTGVAAFRNLALGVKRRVRKIKASADVKHGPNGRQERTEEDTAYGWESVETTVSDDLDPF